MKARNNLLATALALAVPLCTWAQTESEPNDNIANANTITLGTAMNGDMGGAPCGSGTSDDFFRLDLLADGQLTFNTNAANSGAGSALLRLYVYNSGGSQIAYFDHVTGANSVPSSVSTDWVCASKGTYYVRTYRLSGSVCYTYALTVSLTAPLFADDLELNNSKADADANPLLPESTTTEGHINFNHYGDNTDWYHIQTPGNGVLNVILASEASAAGNIRVYVHNGGGAQLDYYDRAIGTGGVAAVDTVSLSCYGAGDYYLRIYSLSACGVSYQLSWYMTAPLFANDAEPNNNKAQADLNPILPANTAREGHINFNNYGDNVDWHHIQTSGNGVLNVVLASEAVAAGNIRVYVHNGGGAQLDFYDRAVGTGGIAAVDTVSLSCYGAGDYYLHVQSLSSCGVSYQLSWYMTAPLFDNDAEPNNSKADADANPILAHGVVTEGEVNFSHYGNNAEWYHIQTPVNGVLNVTLASEAAGGGNMRIYVYNGGGSQLAYFDTPVGTGGVPATGTVSYDCYGQGDYYLNVVSLSPCGVSYQLSYTITPAPFTNDTEPNNTTATALAFDPEAYSLHGNLDFNHYGDNMDYYSIHVVGLVPITFDLEMDAGSAGTLRIYLYNSGGSQIDYTDIPFAGGHALTAATVNFTGPFSGNYYLRLTTQSSCGLSYRLPCNDDDDDGVCNTFDLCPGTPNGDGVNGDGCACSQLTVDDGDPCTLDECSNGIVTHTFQDADDDQTCDANDGCPNDPNKIAAGACGCGNTDVPTTWYADNDGDGFGDPNNSQAGFTCDQPMGHVANNTDLCPTDINKQVPGACGCGVADTDTDNDGIADCNDNCPNLAGVQGDACDDLDANTTGDVIDANCECHGTPQGGCVQNEVILSIHGDGVSNVGWTLYDQGGNTVASGGQVYPNGDHAQTLCLADGCYRLAVTDGEGDGILGGGYLLTTAAGQRIIDNTANFSSGSLSAISGNQTFCLPIGSDKPIFASCDKLDWVNNKFIVATANPTVSAQYGVTNTTSGYEFWFYDPNGSYSFRRFRSHATSDGYGSGALRACHFKVNGWTNSMATPHLPANILLNVRVRGRVAGNNLAFGPACQFKIDAALAACPRVKLQDDPANTSDYSCGVNREFGGASRPANRIYANPPQPVPAVASSNVRYQFRFRIAGEGICIVRPPQKSAQLVLNWTNGTPLQCSKTYAVDVRVSLNGGATWCFGPGSSSQAAACADTDDWGKVCEVTINCQEMDGGNNSMALMGDGVFTLYPNPNHGDQLFLNVTNVQQGVNTVNVDMYDLSGKRVWARTIAVQDGFVKTNLDLNGDLAGGMYMVHITAGDKAYTERLVIQP